MYDFVVSVPANVTVLTPMLSGMLDMNVRINPIHIIAGLIILITTVVYLITSLKSELSFTFIHPAPVASRSIESPLPAFIVAGPRITEVPLYLCWIVALYKCHLYISAPGSGPFRRIAAPQQRDVPDWMI